MPSTYSRSHPSTTRTTSHASTRTRSHPSTCTGHHLNPQAKSNQALTNGATRALKLEAIQALSHGAIRALTPRQALTLHHQSIHIWQQTCNFSILGLYWSALVGPSDGFLGSSFYLSVKTLFCH